MVKSVGCVVPCTVQETETGVPSGKSIDAAGAGKTWSSPGWLTQLNLLWSGKGVRHASSDKQSPITSLALRR